MPLLLLREVLTLLLAFSRWWWVVWKFFSPMNIGQQQWRRRRACHYYKTESGYCPNKYPANGYFHRARKNFHFLTTTTNLVPSVNYYSEHFQNSRFNEQKSASRLCLHKSCLEFLYVFIFFVSNVWRWCPHLREDEDEAGLSSMIMSKSR